MDITVARESDWTVIALSGALDVESSAGVYLQFQQALRHGRVHVAFDLQRVQDLDTKGLGVLVRCYRDARCRGGEVALRHVPPAIARVLEFTRLDAIFPVADEDLPPLDGPDTEAA